MARWRSSRQCVWNKVCRCWSVSPSGDHTSIIECHKSLSVEWAVEPATVGIMWGWSCEDQDALGTEQGGEKKTQWSGLGCVTQLRCEGWQSSAEKRGGLWLPAWIIVIHVFSLTIELLWDRVKSVLFLTGKVRNWQHFCDEGIYPRFKTLWKRQVVLFSLRV